MAQHPVLVQSASLHGKVALITGAGRGIGRGCAIELGKRGASVVVNYANSKSAADEVCSIIEASGTGAKAISIQADVSKKSEIERLFEETKAHFGKIDIVMSNSGTESWDKTEEITEEKYDHVFNLNARAQFFVGQAAWKYLEDGGRLILMSSIAAGLLGVRDHVLYNASKMAVIGMIKAFATDFGVRGITVNGVAPGGIKSDMFTQNAWHCELSPFIWNGVELTEGAQTFRAELQTGRQRRLRASWLSTALSSDVLLQKMSLASLASWLLTMVAGSMVSRLSCFKLPVLSR